MIRLQVRAKGLLRDLRLPIMTAGDLNDLTALQVHAI